MIDNTNFLQTSYKIKNLGEFQIFQNGFQMTFSETGIKVMNTLLLILFISVGFYYLLKFMIYLGIRIFDFIEESYKEYKISLKKNYKISKDNLLNTSSTLSTIEDKVKAKKKPGRKKKILA